MLKKQGIIWVVDSCDLQRLEECKRQLAEVFFFNFKSENVDEKRSKNIFKASFYFFERLKSTFQFSKKGPHTGQAGWCNSVGVCQQAGFDGGNFF